MSTPRDREELVFNPVTGNLDTVRIFNPDRIISHSLNPQGNVIMQYDPICGVYYEAGPEIVFSNDGSVVTT